MWMQTSNEPVSRFSSRRRWFALCIAAAALIPAVTSAQSQIVPLVVLMKSALHSIPAEHWLVVTAAEVGAATAQSEVTIEIRDASDQRRGFTTGVMLRNRPVRLRVPIPAGGGLQQLRAIVKISPLPNNLGSEPIVSMEDVDGQSLKIETKPPCAPPPGTESGVIGNCDGGWRVNRLTLDQANHLPD